MTAKIREFSPFGLLGSLNSIEEKYAPENLWVSGDRDILRQGGRVSIVGSRRATADGIRRAARLAKILVNAGHVVVSGLAAGIDTAAHKNAIEHGGRTIGVIGTGIDKEYPRENAELQHDMMETQLVVTQFKPGTGPLGKNFPQRNRTMAMISDATVIIEAEQKSGTVHQGWEALRLGRMLWITQSLLDKPGVEWPHKMMKYGARALTQESVIELVGDLPERCPEWFENAVCF